MVLDGDFLRPKRLRVAELARESGVAPQTLRALIRKRRSITAKTALGLADALATTPQFWMNLQANFDLWRAQRRLNRTHA